MNQYIYLRSLHSDKGLAERLTEAIEQSGHKVWLGQEGDDPQQQRQTAFAIERSDAYMLLLAPEVLNATGISRELALAKDSGKPIYLVQLRPVELPSEWPTEQDSWSLVDLSDDFDAGLAALLQVLAHPEATVDEIEETGDFFGGDHFGRVAALSGEQIIWADSGLYWFNKWRTLVRVLVTLTDRRLIFFWDERDVWKWKPREIDQLEEGFPFALPLDKITAVGEVQRPKSFLIFATGKPFVEVTFTGDKIYRFSLQTDFEAQINTLRDTVAGQQSITHS